AVAPTNHEVAHFPAQMLMKLALYAIDEVKVQLRHAQADGSVVIRVAGVTAESRIDAGVAFQLLARTDAGVGQSLAEQAGDHRSVLGVALALADQFAIPLEPVAFEGAQDRILGTRHFPWRVEVLHARQPAAANGAGIEIGGERGDQRTNMQVAAGGGGEAPNVGCVHEAKARNRAGRLSAPSSDQEPICFSLISASVLQSMQRVAVGRASRRRIPISTPQESHQPYSLSSISCRVSSIFLISLRSRS